MVDCRIITPKAAMGPTLKAAGAGHRVVNCPICSKPSAPEAEVKRDG